MGVQVGQATEAVRDRINKTKPWNDNPGFGYNHFVHRPQGHHQNSSHAFCGHPLRTFRPSEKTGVLFWKTPNGRNQGAKDVCSASRTGLAKRNLQLSTTSSTRSLVTEPLQLNQSPHFQCETCSRASWRSRDADVTRRNRLRITRDTHVHSPSPCLFTSNVT